MSLEKMKETSFQACGGIPSDVMALELPVSIARIAFLSGTVSSPLMDRRWQKSSTVWLTAVQTVKQLNDIALLKSHLTVTGCQLQYGITQFYLPPDTSELTPPYRSQTGWYSINLSRMDGRLTWPVIETFKVHPLHSRLPLHAPLLPLIFNFSLPPRSSPLLNRRPGGAL